MNALLSNQSPSYVTPLITKYIFSPHFVLKQPTIHEFPINQSIKFCFCILVLCLKLMFSGTCVNLANNNGGGGMQNRPRLYSASRKTQGFHFAVFSPPNNRYENISTFFSCFPLFNSVSKKIFLGRKKILKRYLSHSLPPPPPH